MLALKIDQKDLIQIGWTELNYWNSQYPKWFLRKFSYFLVQGRKEGTLTTSAIKAT